MFRMPLSGFGALVLMSMGAFSGIASAADPLPATTQIVAAPAAAAPTTSTFTIASTEDLVITLTDLQIPSPVASAGVVVTQAGAIVASAQFAAPATAATATLPAANGDYVMYVFGAPNPGFSVGTYTACVAPKSAPANCIQSASTSGNITVQSSAQDATVSTLSRNLTVTAADTYTFTFVDLQFPAVLNSAPNLALFQGSTSIALGIASGTSILLQPGTYQLLALAQADQTSKAGLYSLSIVGTATAASLLNEVEPVGLIPAAHSFVNNAAQPVTLTVTDYAFPGPLASASAILTAGAIVVGSASSVGGAVSLTAPAGSLELWTYGSVGATAGTFSADVSAGSIDLYTTAQGVGPVGSTFAYAFVTQPLPAGPFQATAGDLQFPSQLTGLSFAVAQNGIILQQSTTAATLSFTAVAGNAVLLVAAQTPASGSATGNGLFDVNVQTTGAASQLYFDKTQSVSSAGAFFNSVPVTVSDNTNFDAVLTDLMFPTAFDNLSLVVSRGTEIEGKIFGGGKFTFAGTPGIYQLTFVATPSAMQQFGVYATSVVLSVPTVMLTSSVATATTGSSIQLSWSSSNATGCTASGGSWSGSKATTSTTESVVLSATTTYTLSCTGPGGTTTQSVNVTATPAAAAGGHGGGGAVDEILLLLGLGVWLATQARRDGSSGTRSVIDNA